MCSKLSILKGELRFLVAIVPHIIWDFPGDSDVCFTLQCRRPRFDAWVRKTPLEKEMATHSSTLAWKILWMEEPGRLQPMGLQRVGHD